ncbi:hypothetical protein HDU98_011357 [Podochytrium sp. JEL0797]|nr:hypothetical protein HDU98_011357 [Podochytrium sp. JEL0797]
MTTSGHLSAHSIPWKHLLTQDTLFMLKHSDQIFIPTADSNSVGQTLDTQIRPPYHYPIGPTEMTAAPLLAKPKVSSSSFDNTSKPEKILTQVKKGGNSAGGGSNSSSSPTKTRVSISFKHIAAYQPAPKTPGVGERGKALVFVDPVFVNLSEIKSEEERRKLEFKLKLKLEMNRQLAKKGDTVVEKTTRAPYVCGASF